MMPGRPSLSPSDSAVSARLSRLAPLSEYELQALSAAQETRHRVAAHREIIAEGRPVDQPSILLSGWASRTRVLSDGRRQILSLLLPGDMVGVCRQSNPVAATSVVALTEVTLCRAPRPEIDQIGMTEAYARSAALEEYYLFRQIARIGRMSAYERIVDLFLEVQDRLAVVDLARADGFPLPLTQEGLADLLGLTSVHVNRTLQTLRREGLLEWRGGTARLFDRDRLAGLVEYRTAIVSAG